MKNSKAKGFRQHSSNGAGGTLVYYRANTNFELLYDKIFIVKAIYPISRLSHVAKTDDTNYVFELYNKELGKIYYKFEIEGPNNVIIYVASEKSQIETYKACTLIQCNGTYLDENRKLSLEY